MLKQQMSKLKNW